MTLFQAGLLMLAAGAGLGTLAGRHHRWLPDMLATVGAGLCALSAGLGVVMWAWAHLP